MGKKDTCAYCDGPPPFTREHIWPNGFLKRGDFGVRFSAKANKTFTGDLVVADVCARCNNGPLSVLDAHACELYDRRFGKFVEAGETVPFTYDHGLLMRWLLKTSYNSARSGSQDRKILAEYRKTIIAPDPCTPVFMAAFVATVIPSTLIKEATGERRKIYPQAARSGPIQFGDAEDEQIVLRTVQINSFFFTLLIMRQSAMPVGRMGRIISKVPGQPVLPVGRMRVGPPSIPAHMALAGVEKWPPLQKQR